MLKIMFIDESKTKKGEYLALTGIVVKSEILLQLVDDLDAICRGYIGDEFSLKEKKVCLKLLRKTRTKAKNNPFTNIDSIKRGELSQKIYFLLEKYECKIISCVVENNNARNHQKCVSEGIYFLIERFFYELESDFGVIISDGCDDLELKRQLIETIQLKEYRSKKFTSKIYPNIYFTDDEDDILVQLADLISFNLTSYISSCVKEISFSDLANKFDFGYNLENSKYFKMIRKHFRSRNGKINGNGIKILE